MILYIDESGDLGFDFTYPKTTRVFVMTALVCEDSKADLSITKAVRKTLKNKSARTTMELKGSNTDVAIKKYFFRHIDNQGGWILHAVIFDKRSWAKRHKQGKHIDQNMFYDEATKRLLKQIDFSSNELAINLIVDKSKNQENRDIFNEHIRAVIHSQSSSRKTSLQIKHRSSQEDLGLQAVDLFCWGIRRKHQYNDEEWYSMFANRIATETEVKF